MGGPVVFFLVTLGLLCFSPATIARPPLHTLRVGTPLLSAVMPCGAVKPARACSWDGCALFTCSYTSTQPHLNLPPRIDRKKTSTVLAGPQAILRSV